MSVVSLKRPFPRTAKTVATVLCCIVSTGMVLVVGSSPAVADTDTYTSAQVGTSGQTPQFSQTGHWTMAWSYDCSAYGSPGNFIVNVNQPAGDPVFDIGTNEVGSSGSGTDSYFDTGVFSLSVDSECKWSITANPSSAPPDPHTTTYTSAEIGVTGHTPQFLEQGPWALGWSYQCPGAPGNFIVDVNQPADDSTPDSGPNQLGTSGAGLDFYNDAGVFSLTVSSGCSWTINVDGTLPQPVTGMAATPDGGGYWLADASGGVSPHGDAGNYGSMALEPLAAPIEHIVATPDGRGYWLVGADGGVFTFGDAGFFGSMGGHRLDAPVVDIAPTADGRGYWLVASDGGVFAFGDASFLGSMGGQHLQKPVVGMAPDYGTGGYWLVASDGGVFAFDAPFEGSMGGVGLRQPVTGMSGTPNDLGYWLVASDGGIFAFNAPFDGSMGVNRSSLPSWAWPPTGSPLATGWWDRTAGSSASTPRSSEPADDTRTDAAGPQARPLSQATAASGSAPALTLATAGAGTRFAPLITVTARTKPTNARRDPIRKAAS